jgi:hypothetical protein
MKKPVKSGSNSYLLTWFLLITLCVVYGCTSNEKKKIDSITTNKKNKSESLVLTEKKVENSTNKEDIKERTILNLKPVKSDGLAVVLGEGVTFYNVDQFEMDSGAKYGEIFEILEVSEDKYPKGNEYHCEQFPYIHLSNSRIEGWVSGKFVYRINGEPERIIEISDKPYLIYKSVSFGIGSIDSVGNFTGCLDYFPILVKSVNENDYYVIELVGENPIYKNVQCLVFYDADELIDISQDSIFTVLKIKTEGMEGGKFYDLKLTKTDKDSIKGEITNVSDWTF